MLHVFVEASNQSYGACGYIYSGENSTLVFAKNKVSPLKVTTIPMLALFAATLGARLARNIYKTQNGVYP